MPTHYEVLELAETASDESIADAFRRFSAKTMSESAGTGSTDEGIEGRLVKDAYQVLSNPVLRARYDQKLKVSRMQAATVQYVEQAPIPVWQQSWVKVGVLLVVLLGGYWTYARDRDARIEQARLELERERIKKERDAETAEMEREAGQRQEELLAARERARQEADIRRAQNEANSAYRAQQYREERQAADRRRSEEQAQRTEEYARQQAANSRRRETQQYLREVEQEKANTRNQIDMEIRRAEEEARRNSSQGNAGRGATASSVVPTPRRY